MGGASLRLPDLSCAGKAVGNRHSFSAGNAQPAGKALSRSLQASTKLAGRAGCASARSPAAAPAATDHAERQRERSSRADPAAPAQAVKIKYRSRQNRLPARAVLRLVRAGQDLSQANRTIRHRRRDEAGPRRNGQHAARMVRTLGENDYFLARIPQPARHVEKQFHSRRPQSKRGRWRNVLRPLGSPFVHSLQLFDASHADRADACRPYRHSLRTTAT